MSEEFDEDVYGEAVDNDAHNDSGNEDDGDEFEKMLEVHRKDIWSTGGLKKDETVRELIKCFGSMIESHPKEYAIPDHSGKYKTEDMLYTKLLDAPKYVTKAKRALIENENFDNRNFSIFIANKRWAKNILRPLLELCAKDDSTLAMRCCSLALVLIRRLSEASQKILQDSTRGAKRKASSLDLQQNEDEKEDDEKLKAEKGMNAAAIDEDSVRKEKAALLMRIENVKQQVSALLSFKDALCSDKCNEAIANAFKELWLKEQVTTTEDNKMGVAICFSYLRRILAIDSHPQWSTPGEIQLHRSIHDKYIVQLRLLLSVVPGICSDILRSYHNDWLGDIILIIYFTLRGFEPKDLYRVWRTGALIEDFENLDSYDTTVDADGLTGSAAGPGQGHRTLVDVVVPTALAQSAAQQSSAKGKLTQLLQRDRNARLQVPGGRGAGGVMAGAAARFRGVYQRPVAHTAALPALSSGASGAATGNTSSELDHILGSTAPRNPATGASGAAATGANAESAEPPVQCHLQVSKIVRDPFQLSGAAVPPVQAKRNRKNLTFSLDTTLSEVTGALYQSGEDHQKAAVVAATLVNLLSNELSLKPLVKRVNEDLRRDDMRVGQDLELRYFDILYRVLHYNRLKLTEEYREFQGGANASSGWQPNLKNVMDALDRMSFTRAVSAIERMSKNAQHNDDVVVAMALYKEMVCYLRVLLESSLEGHHEIAIAALHRLFYAASEKLDPLPKLLSAWKSGTYPRRHLSTLVELVHETLKTLEAAQIRFRPEGDKNAEEWARRKYKKKSGKNEMDLEQYVMACMRFKVDDYFKRIVSSHTVRMYTKLLTHYDKNDSETNYYAYCFLRRMNAFTLEQDHKAPPPPSTHTSSNTSAAVLESAHSDEVSLGFMLFNIHTLEVFSTIVNDRTVYDNKQMEPLLRLINAILRRFGEAANKNHMLFVELLFQHPRPHEFCCQIDSVYEAPSHAAYVNAAHKRDKALGGTRDADSSAGSGSDSSTDSDEGDYGDEFDENNISAAFAATISEKAKAKAAREAARAAKKAARAEKKQGKGGSRQARREEKKARLAARQAEKQEARASKYAWSAEEDAVLKEQYALYAGTRSVFTSIAQHPDLKALGRNRNETQVAKRVKQLELHMQVSFSDDEEEAELDIEAPHAAGSASNSDGEQDDDQDSDDGDAGKRRRKVVEDPDFGGILFSDEDDVEMEIETEPLETQRTAKASQRSTVATQLDTQRATQQATQASTQEQRQLLSSFSTQSPVLTTKNRRPERAARSTGAGSKDSENNYAHIFSPSDSSLNLEEEGDETQPTQPQRAPTQSQSQSASTQPQIASATQASSAPTAAVSKAGTSAKKAKLRETAPGASASATSTAFWDQDDGVDIFEQRSMALLQARGGAGAGAGNASDDDSLLDARATHKRPPAKGLVKKAAKKSKSSRTAASNSDAEDDLFDAGDADTAPAPETAAVVAPEAQKEQKKAIFKKRLMRIDSDEE